MKWGLDILTPTTVTGDDGWKPIMENSMRRKLFETSFDCVTFEAQLRRQGHQTRIVEVSEPANAARRV